MPRTEAILVVASMVSYALGFAMALLAHLSGRDRLYKGGRAAVLVGLVAHTAALAHRWVTSGHMPIATPYENASFSAWTMVALTYAAPRSWTLFRAAGLGATAIALVMFGWGIMQPTEVTPMVASLKSFWLYIHVFFAIIAFGAYAVASGVSLSYLWKTKVGDKGFLASLPDLDALDRTVFLYVVFGFITEAVMIAAGAIWAKDLWGSYWSWDPVETWSLVSWLIYGVMIHLRVTFGWRDARFAWGCMFAVIFVAVAYFGVGFVFSATQHLFTVPEPPSF